MRMSNETFDSLAEKVAPFLQRKYNSRLREQISPAEMLAITLRYLVTGNSQTSISFEFRLGRATVCKTVRVMCALIWQVLSEQYVKVPATEEDWIGISKEFERLWNFPNCAGAIDGKHVVMQCPDCA